MPEVLEDAQDTAESNWKPALAYGLATGFGGNAAGPLGHGAGALLAGSYVGGSRGNAMASIGGGEALAMLLRSGGGNGGGSSSGVTEV